MPEPCQRLPADRRALLAAGELRARIRRGRGPAAEADSPGPECREPKLLRADQVIVKTLGQQNAGRGRSPAGATRGREQRGVASRVAGYAGQVDALTIGGRVAVGAGHPLGHERAFGPAVHVDAAGRPADW